uniref:Androctonin n=1 Tax=Androctonus australis TaxID=6858 RepID=ANDT_ANDAU|nr:RecName: Full=Androctonin [Androctonus australis]1CZ6_A Chain A, PROTEIN (ANDROCTONIN) [Androctonus australis]
RSVCRQIKICRRRGGCYYKCTNRPY